MYRWVQKYIGKEGLPPGAISYFGQKRTHDIELQLTTYNQKDLESQTLKDIKSLPELKSSHQHWINVTGVHNTEIIQELGQKFEIPNLVLEDVLNTDHRPKIEELDDLIFVTLKMLRMDKSKSDVVTEQISLLLKDNILISFQQDPEDIFGPIRKRLEKPTGRIRTDRADYLLFALMDIIVDHYLVVLEKLGDKIEDFEKALLNGISEDLINRMGELRNQLSFFRRQIHPVTEICHQLQRPNNQHIDDDHYNFFRDVYDHNIKAVDAADAYKDMLTSALETHMLLVSYKANEIMKFLTIFASIFIPLTFLAGIYGMNFEYMPELQWKWSYPSLILIMLVLGGFLLHRFKKKGWL